MYKGTTIKLTVDLLETKQNKKLEDVEDIKC